MSGLFRTQRFVSENSIFIVMKITADLKTQTAPNSNNRAATGGDSLSER